MPTKLYQQAIDVSLKRALKRSHSTLAEIKRQHSQAHHAGKSPFGLNLVGAVRAETGIGQMIRTTGLACRSANINFGMNNITAGLGDHISMQDDRWDKTLQKNNPYCSNLIYANGNALLGYCYHFGESFFKHKYNIAYWTWELENYPKAWIKMTSVLHEIWTISSFMQMGLQAVTNKPIIHMPIAVEDMVLHYQPKRRDYGLPDDRYLFFNTFDYTSFIKRKNPSACAKAFLQAFPKSQTQVGLVIKLNYADPNSPDVISLYQLAEQDERIILLEKPMRYHEAQGLKSVCDSFISLHRAEGFGLNMAEAMLMGKPVIATNYSGNVDFMYSNNSCPVNYSLIPIQTNEYFDDVNQVWAEPDIEHAAWYMRKLFNEPQFGKALGGHARQHILQHHSPAVVGEKYKQRLQALGL